MTEEQSTLDKKKQAKSKLLSALAIGFLAGIFLFGMFAWLLSPKRQIGFLIPMMIPIILIYKIVKGRK